MIHADKAVLIATTLEELKLEAHQSEMLASAERNIVGAVCRQETSTTLKAFTHNDALFLEKELNAAGYDVKVAADFSLNVYWSKKRPKRE